MRPFSIDHNRIKDLPPDQLVDLVRNLIVGQARKVGLPVDQTHVSADINTRDGGLDGRVSVDVPADCEWLPPGISGWQMKAEDLSKTTAARTPFPKYKSNLSPRVQRLLTNNGTFVLVCSRKDPPNPEDWANAIKVKFKEKGFPEGKAIVYGTSQIAEWANEFPSLIAEFNPSLGDCLGFDTWGKQQTISDLPFVPDQKRKGIIKSIQTILNEQDGAPKAISISGLSGVGKSRLVYEALNCPELKDFVVYVPDADRASTSLINSLATASFNHAILVVDDCSDSKHRLLAEAITGHRGKVSLITISQERRTNTPENTLQYAIDPLDEQTTEELINKISPGIPASTRRRVVYIAEGYPVLVSILCSQAYKDGDLYSSQRWDETGLSHQLDRLINGHRLPGSSEALEVKRILSILSIFSKLGWREELETQGKAVMETLGIDWNRAIDVIAFENKRGIVRSMGRYRAVTPHPLAVQLAKYWWETYSCTVIINLIQSHPNEPFINSLFDQMKASAGQRPVKDCAAHLLKSIDFTGLCTEQGSRLFHELAYVSPEAAVQTLERCLLDKSDDDLMKLKPGRRYIVWSLEWLVKWPDIFDKASAILLRLAVVETEDHISNNSSHTWVKIFQPVLSGTATPLNQRLSILKQIFNSENHKKRTLAISGLGHILQLGSVTSSISSTKNVALLPPQDWRPKTEGDIIDPARESLQHLVDIAQGTNAEEADQAIKLITKRAPGLIQSPLTDEAVDALDAVVNTLKRPRQDIINAIGFALNRAKTKYVDNVRDRLHALQLRLQGTDFNTQMQRFVGLPHWAGNNEQEDWRKSQAFKEEQVHRLATQAIANPQLLIAELDWLISPEAENAIRFGEQLGILDEPNRLLPIIWNATKSKSDNSCGLVGGYLIALKARNVEAGEIFLQQAAKETPDHAWMVDFCWRFGSTAASRRIITEGIQSGNIEYTWLNMLGIGRWADDMTPEELSEFLSTIFAASVDAAPELIKILASYMHGKSELSGRLASITNTLLVSTTDLQDGSSNNRNWYLWKVLGDHLLDFDNNFASNLSEGIVRAVCSESNLTIDRYLREVFVRCIGISPKRAWDVIAEQLEQDRFSIYMFQDWIKDHFSWSGGKSAPDLISLFPSAIIWDWAAGNEDRPYYLTQLVQLHGQETLNPMAKELLKRYGHLEDVAGGLRSNFGSEDWSGPVSLHYNKKLELVEKWKSENEHPSVVQWLDTEIRVLKARIKKAEQEEAERDF